MYFWRQWGYVVNFFICFILLHDQLFMTMSDWMEMKFVWMDGNNWFCCLYLRGFLLCLAYLKYINHPSIYMWLIISTSSHWCHATISTISSHFLFRENTRQYTRNHKPPHVRRPKISLRCLPILACPSRRTAPMTQLRNSLALFIAGGLLPLSTADSPRFRSLMFQADPRFQVPSRKHLASTLLPHKLSQLQDDLLRRMKQADRICTTLDLWSSRQMRSYLGITGHFILDWSLYSVMLSCSRFQGAQRAEATTEKYHNTLAQFEISGKEWNRQCSQYDKGVPRIW